MLPTASTAQRPEISIMGSPFEGGNNVGTTGNPLSSNREFAQQRNLFSIVEEFNYLLMKAEYENEIEDCPCFLQVYHIQKKYNNEIEIVSVDNSCYCFKKTVNYTQGIAKNILESLSEESLMRSDYAVDYLLRNEEDSEDVKKLLKIFVKANLLLFIRATSSRNPEQAKIWLMSKFNNSLKEKIENTLNHSLVTEIQEILRSTVPIGIIEVANHVNDASPSINPPLGYLK